MAIVTRLNLTDLRVLQSATVTEFSATNVAGSLSTGQPFRITGAGFAAPDATGLPTLGTVTGLQIIPPFGLNANSIAVSDLSMPMGELRTYIAGNLVDGFLFSALAGNDTLSGSYLFRDMLTGYGGDDRITIQSDPQGDTWNGGPGNDTFVWTDVSIDGIIDGGVGVDTLLLLSEYGSFFLRAQLSSIERIGFPDAPHSELYIDYSAAILDGDVTIFGGAGVDVVQVNDVAGPISAVHFMLANWDADDLLIFVGSGTVTGGPGNDNLAAGSALTALIGGGGDDTLFGPFYTPSTISFDGGDGVDTAVMNFLYENGPLSYAVGDSAVRENGVNFVATTSIERVYLTGGRGADTLVGGAGDDTLEGGPGGDVLNGAAGFDVVSYAFTQVALTINVAAGSATWGPDAVGDVLSNFEGVRGGEFGDVMITDGTMALFGGSGDDRLYGSNAADRLAGEYGNDVLIGLGGDDIATLGEGVDYFYGGGGNDTGSGGGGVDVLLGEAGNDTLSGGDGQDYLYGGDGNDTLSGDWGVDVLLGGAGNDVMNGGTGGDYLYGEDGNDTGNGGDGNDIFVMVAGNDTANGDDGQDYFYMGDGDDVMNGGAGVDVMLGEAGNDTFNGGLGVDYLFLGPQGAGDNDTVILDKTNTGVQVVFNFEAGGANDVVRLVGSGLTTLQQVTANISDFTASGGFCILTLDADTSVWFIGVAPNQLTSADFLFA